MRRIVGTDNIEQGNWDTFLEAQACREFELSGNFYNLVSAFAI